MDSETGLAVSFFRYSRYRNLHRVSALVALLALTACGPSSGGAGGSSDAERAALAASPFADPLIMDLPGDGYAQSLKLAALRGVDYKQTYGAAWETNDYFPCVTTGRPGFSPTFIRGYHFYMDALSAWLEKSGLIEIHGYAVAYPNAEQKDAVNTLVYNCVVIKDAVAPNVVTFDNASNLHGGIHIRIARRELASWTYKNQYETDMPGKGKVQVFAGTMAYRMVPVVPDISFTGQGEARLKMMLDPDTGKWTVLEAELHDPPLALAGFAALAPG